MPAPVSPEALLLHHELEPLVRCIYEIRDGIAGIRAEDTAREHIPAASDQLDVVAEHLEEAAEILVETATMLEHPPERFDEALANGLTRAVTES